MRREEIFQVSIDGQILNLDSTHVEYVFHPRPEAFLFTNDDNFRTELENNKSVEVINLNGRSFSLRYEYMEDHIYVNNEPSEFGISF